MRSQNFIDIVLIHQYWFRNSANLIHRSNYAPFETKTSSYYLMILHTSAWKNKALLFRVSFGHRGNCQLHSQLSFFFSFSWTCLFRYILYLQFQYWPLWVLFGAWHLIWTMKWFILLTPVVLATRRVFLDVYIYQVDFLRISLFIIHIFFSRVSWLICTIDGFNCLHPLYDWARNFRKNILCCYETICCPILGN